MENKNTNNKPRDRKADKRLYRRKNRKRIQEYAKQYLIDNKEHIDACNKRYRLKNAVKRTLSNKVRRQEMKLNLMYSEAKA